MITSEEYDLVDHIFLKISRAELQKRIYYSKQICLAHALPFECFQFRGTHFFNLLVNTIICSSKVLNIAIDVKFASICVSGSLNYTSCSFLYR